MVKTLRRIYSGITTAIIVAVVILALLLAGVRLLGVTPYTVLSGSMEPTYHVGALIYVQETDPMALQAGDPVTYRMSDGIVVTHRIIEVVEDPVSGRCYRTKGDANNIADGALLLPGNVMGKPIFTIPYLGYVSWFIQNPPGTYIVIAGCVMLLALTMLTDTIFPEKKEPAPEEPNESV